MNQVLRHYQEYLDSGLSVQDFCSNQNFAVSTFYYWKKKLETKAPTPDFIPLHASNHPMVNAHKYPEVGLPDNVSMSTDSHLEFAFPNGTKLQIKGQVDPALLKTIVHLF